MSMRAYVFPDAALMPVAARFVWLSINTEKPGNEAFLNRYPISEYPTLMVFDSAGRPVRRWLGSVTAAELAARLSEVAEELSPGHPQARAERAFDQASAELAHESVKPARIHLQEALDRSEPRTLLHGQAAESLLFLLYAQHELDRCARLAAQELPRIAPGTSLANVASTGLSCAVELPSSDPVRVRLLAATEDRVTQIARDPAIGLLPDDRSGLYETLVDAYRAQGRDAEVRQTAGDWVRFLEGEAERAPTPAARAVFDPHRMLAYGALGELSKAIPMLQASERDLPDDYNPPARLASVYLQLGRPQEALAAADRALKKAYGPRTVRILLLKAQAQARQGLRSEVDVTLHEAARRAAAVSDRQQRSPLQQDVEDMRRRILK